MAWTANLATPVSGLQALIESNLVAGGWAAIDAANDVYGSTNNQGAANVLQIQNWQSNGSPGSTGAWEKVALQGWASWNTGSHSGTHGSGWMYLQYAPNNVGGATAVDLYMSVTTNRVIILITGTAPSYRPYFYFGGLDSLAGTSDSACVQAFSCQVDNNLLAILQGILNQSSWWQGNTLVLPCASGNNLHSQFLAANPAEALMWPMSIQDYGSLFFRGNLDGMYFVPGGTNTPGAGPFTHCAAVTQASITYLFWQPPNYSSLIDNTSFINCLAVAEV